LAQQMSERFQPRRTVHCRKDRQIEQAVVDQGVRTERYAAARLPAVAYCERQEASLP
jgi:hypothetical protein